MFGDTRCHSLILAICMSLWEHVCVWHMNNAHVDLLRKCGWTTLLEPVSNTEVKTACRVFYQRCWFFLTLIIMPYVFGHALMNVKVGHTGNWLVLLGRISIPWELYFHNGWDYVMRGAPVSHRVMLRVQIVAVCIAICCEWVILKCMYLF